MNNIDKFQGAYKTTRASYKELNLCSLWFNFGFKNCYKITKEQDKKGNFFAIWDTNKNKIIKKLRLKNE